MTPITCFSGNCVALFGLGRSGVAAARALEAGGADVHAWDDSEGARAKARSVGLNVTDLAEADWTRFAALVLSPGVPLTHPAPHWTVELARASGVETIGDVELFCREREKLAGGAPLIAITGTNGKSTTTALIAHILRAAGKEAELGGNIGTPILELAPPSEARIHVIECSSFQIELSPSISPTIGILINLTPDHLDRHGSMENYAAVKERLLARAEIALVGVDDPFTHTIGERLSQTHSDDQRVVPVSGARSLEWGFFVEGMKVLFREFGHGPEEAETLADLAGVPSLRGAHNAQNAAFACAAAWHCGLEDEDIAAALRSFPGLPHRMEEVGRRGGLLFINDSKATNADAAEKALLCFDDIFWIAGGRAKEGGIEPLRAHFPRIRKAYLIGEAAEDFAKTLESAVEFERCGELGQALARAAADAAQSEAAEPIVLLSPACASYDQFANFEARGDAFRTLVRELYADAAQASGDETP